MFFRADSRSLLCWRVSDILIAQDQIEDFTNRLMEADTQTGLDIQMMIDVKTPLLMALGTTIDTCIQELQTMQSDSTDFLIYKNNLRSMFDMMLENDAITLVPTNCIIPALPVDMSQYEQDTFELREMLIALDAEYSVELTFKAYIE